MELREWLIILGLALVSLIVIDGVRRLQRQRRVPRLDQGSSAAGGDDPDAAARAAELDWELPNGGARVVRAAEDGAAAESFEPPRRHSAHGHARTRSEEAVDAAPARQAPTFREPHGSQPVEPGVSIPDSGVAGRADEQDEAPVRVPLTATDADDDSADVPPINARHENAHRDSARLNSVEEPAEENGDEDENVGVKAGSAPRRHLRADTVGDHEDEGDDEEAVDEPYRLVDVEEIGRSMKKRLVKQQKARQQKKEDRKEEKARRAAEREKERAEREAREQQAREEREEQQRQLEAQQAEADERARQAEASRRAAAGLDSAAASQPDAAERSSPALDGFTARHEPQSGSDAASAPAAEPVMDPVLEKALRNDIPGGQARHTLTGAEEVIVISVLAREENGFDGARLLKLLMACGLRYSRGLGVFHRFETESEDSELQFSMVNVVKPGSFPVEDGEPFSCPGVTFLMPLPGAEDSAAAFEAMVETAMVVVRHLGGELKDENHSVMTAQTIEFTRQQVHEFERRHRLNRQLQAQ
ncbi:cell division protein ZipA C-terminal FtsZ-binding domain-containing protein [Vreelandella jeotgali]|uniref:cell division protein ZipA C-terminal FtsZ-binding domain-containing protein n=1 Tax=Vreelandella jeotgali TaxID=553386 RepID=UPI000348B95A|nr:cell division protein ZipA C-terminal FtsZ-binding domain-containing protein [Halomonas jeotgali]